MIEIRRKRLSTGKNGESYFDHSVGRIVWFYKHFTFQTHYTIVRDGKKLDGFLNYLNARRFANKVKKPGEKGHYPIEPERIL